LVLRRYRVKSFPAVGGIFAPIHLWKEQGPVSVSESNNNVKYNFYLPNLTLIKVFLSLVILIAIKTLAPLIMTLVLASLIAVSIAPLVYGLERRGFKKSWSVVIISAFFTLVIIGFLAAVVPSLVSQFSDFLADLPKLKIKILETLSPSSPLRPIFERGLSNRATSLRNIEFEPLFNAGHVVLGGFSEVVLIFIFSVYLVLDGEGVFNWVSAFFSEENQIKLKTTAKEMAPIIFAYISGQVITSGLSFVYVLIALLSLDVPGALLLATLAGVFDVIPVLGFFLAVIPAMVFALTKSTSTAILVFLLYVLYHGIENYFIVPAVYGKRLRVSGFVVILTLIAAGLLAGFEGAIAALPIVASYPIIERTWLKKFVGKNTVTEHAVHKPGKGIPEHFV
jgi:predicted PurR-regulated permease PerM